MKTMTCDMCDFEAQGETFEAWMNALKPHYAEAHKDFMQEQMQKSQEEQMASMKKWMDENKARFEAL